MGRALVLAEGALGKDDGKTAHGLVLHAMRDEIVAVIDSHHAGKDAGETFTDRKLGIPVVADYAEGKALSAIDTLYLGAAPVGGKLPPVFRATVVQALHDGLTVYSGLHSFLSDDPTLQEAATKGGGKIIDVRRPPDPLIVASGRIYDCPTPRILVMGTDCAIGKRVTVAELVKAARQRGINAGFVATGQTGCMLGPDAGAAIDRIPSDFCAGEVERMVCDVAEQGKEVVFIPAQASILHPAFSGVSLAILHGSLPHAIILQHHPGRAQRALFSHPAYQVADVEKEIALIEALSGTSVVAISVNGQGVDDIEAACEELSRRTGRIAVDPLTMDITPLLETALKEARSKAKAQHASQADRPRATTA
jgi:uncharacterized NAD-dependent epimerase/dehydratase family protein